MRRGLGILIWWPLMAAELPEMAKIREAMEASLAKQRASAAAAAPSLEAQRQSVARQEQAAARFAPPSLPAFAAPACDPMPAAQVEPLLESAARREDLPVGLLRAVARQESGFRPCAVSRAGAVGLMQLMPANFARLGIEDAFDPRQSIDSGARFLKELLVRYGGDAALALGAYNAGPARVDAAGGVPAIPETVNYVRSILGALADPADAP